MSDINTALNWRRAIKVFDVNKKVSEVNVAKIIQSIEDAPSSYGLQPFYVLNISDKAVLKQLQAAAYNQPQFSGASNVLVFVAHTNINARIDEYIALAAGGMPASEGLNAYANMMRAAVGNLDENSAKTWAQKQAYIALGFALVQAALLGIDSCPMEGFSNQDFDKILSLPQGHYSSVLLALGYRDEKTHLQSRLRFKISK